MTPTEHQTNTRIRRAVPHLTARAIRMFRLVYLLIVLDCATQPHCLKLSSYQFRWYRIASQACRPHAFSPPRTQLRVPSSPLNFPFPIELTLAGQGYHLHYVELAVFEPLKAGKVAV